MEVALSWKDRKVLDVLEEFSSRSATFGRLLLENVPMQPRWKVIDIGFGKSIPIIDLSQRFNVASKIYGIDLLKDGVIKTRKKTDALGFPNVEIFEQRAASIPLEDESIDLICSNVGISTYHEKEKIFVECNRVLKKGKHFCLTTNPIGTFAELFDIFEQIFKELKQPQLIPELKSYIKHRGTKESTVQEITKQGFQLQRELVDRSSYCFKSALSVLNHSLIRKDFLTVWDQIVPEELQPLFYKNLLRIIDQEILKEGTFKLSIPLLYLEFTK